MDSLMTLGVVLSFVDEFSKPLGELQKSVSGITKNFKDTRLDKLSSDIEHIEKSINSQNKLKFKLSKKIQDATQKADELYKNLRALSKKEKELNSQKLELEKKFKKGKISADELKKAIKKIDNSLNSLNNEKIKINNELEATKNSANSAKRTIDRVDSAISKLNSKRLNLKGQFESVKREIESANTKLNNFSLKVAKISAIGAGVGKMALGKIGSFVSEWKQIEQAQGDIASLDVSESGIDKITKTAIELSNTYSGMVAPDIIKASYDIKSGIATLSDDGVAYYTKLAATTAKATISTTKEMTKLFALTHGIFKGANESDIDFSKRVASSIAQAVKSFRTDGSDLVQGISNIGATAHAMGVSLEQELAIIGNAKEAFSSAAEAGTGYRAFLAGAVGAQKELGLSFVDTKGKLLPMVKILEQIKKKFGKDLDAKEMAKLKKAFGSEEAVKIITALIEKTDKLKKSEQELIDAKISNVEAMAKARNRGGEFMLMMQRLSNLAATVGKVVAPVFDFIAKKIGNLAIKLKDLINDSNFAKWAIIGATGLAALLLTLGTVGLAISAFTALVAFSGKGLLFLNLTSKVTAFTMLLFKGALLGVGGVLQVVAMAAKFASTAFLTLVSFILTNPVGLAISAIAAGAYLIINNWSAISSFLGDLWSSISSIFNSGVDYIVNIFTNPIGFISNNWTNLLNWFGGFWDIIGDIFNSGINFVVNLFLYPIDTISALWANLANWFTIFWQFLSDIFSSGAKYIADIFTAPISWIRKMWGKLLSWLHEKINTLKGLVNSVAKFIGYGKVFDVNINAAGDIGKTTGYIAKNASSITNVDTIKALKNIKTNTKALHKPLKIAQSAQNIKIAPYAPEKKKDKKRHSFSDSGSGVRKHVHGGHAGNYGSSNNSSIGGSRSSGNNYNINITLSGTNESLIAKLQSILPAIISDLENEKIGRAYYDM